MSIDYRVLKALSRFERAKTIEIARIVNVKSAEVKQSLLRLKTKGLCNFTEEDSQRGRGVRKTLFWFRTEAKKEEEFSINSVVVSGKGAVLFFALQRLGTATAKQLAEETGLSTANVASRLVSFVRDGTVTYSMVESGFSNHPFVRAYKLNARIEKKEKNPLDFVLPPSDETKELFSMFYAIPPSKAGREYWLNAN